MVIAILGVIAAVAVPNVIKFMGSGTSAAKAAEMHDVQTAITAALVDGGAVPAHAAAVVTHGGVVGTVGYYLISDTAYKYAWDAGGGNLVQS